YLVIAGHKRLYVLSRVESVSSVEGSRTRRRRRRRRTRPHSQTPSGEHVDCRLSDHLPGTSADMQGGGGGSAAPGPSDQSAFTSKEGTPATEGPPKIQREPKTRGGQRPPTSKRSEGKAKETMVNESVPQRIKTKKQNGSELKLESRTTSNLKLQNRNPSDLKLQNRTASDLKLQNRTTSEFKLQNRTNSE
ncbi:hypothetical protein C0J52_28180, partial [Blattella germanica]